MNSSKEKTEHRSFIDHDVILEDQSQLERFQCKLCKKLMRDPIQTCRGELACKSCYKQALGSLAICPLDGLPIRNTDYFIDKFKGNEILSLICLCKYVKDGCRWKGELKCLEKHSNECTYQPTKCSFCQENLSLDVSIEDHLEKCQNFFTDSSCFYASQGCPRKFSSKADHIKHLKENVTAHSLHQYKLCDKVQKENMELRAQIDALENERVEMSKNFNLAIQKLTEQLTTLEQSMKVMELNMSRVSAKDEGFHDDQTTNELHTKIEVMDKKVSQFDLKQQLLENTIHNGKLLWKIDNFQHRMQQAIIGKVTALHSAPCFTEKYGYKFCARVYLNGDGIGKCTHISLFIVIMKSEYDNLLTWPFTKRVTLSLINQEDKSKSISESFTADRYSSSFQQPKRDMNIAAGCPMFVSKEELTPSKGFLKDDSLFIEMSVE